MFPPNLVEACIAQRRTEPKPSENASGNECSSDRRMSIKSDINLYLVTFALNFTFKLILPGSSFGGMGTRGEDSLGIQYSRTRRVRDGDGHHSW